jgi:outer membrane protein OmpA-like peptidoglycan-associated protein
MIRKYRPNITRQLPAPVALLILLALYQPAQSQSPVAAGAPPVLRVEPGSFSPNDDGLQDFVEIRATGVSDALRRPRDWQLEIRNGRGDIVRTYAADHRLIRQARQLNNLYIPGSEDLRPLHLFDRLIWDGRDDSGQRVPDGVYEALLRVQLPDLGGFVESTALPIIVDTEAPKLEAAAPVSLLVKAHGKGPSLRAAGERLEISQSARSDAGTRYEAHIVNPLGLPIRNRVWQDALPESIFIYWDEVQPQSENDQYGAYTYRLAARDAAGNRSERLISDLLLGPGAPPIDLRGERYHFSPNGDGLRDQIAFRAVYLNQVGNEVPGPRVVVDSYRFQILSADLQTVHYVRTGSGSPDSTILWNGRDASGDILSDGLYFATLDLYSTTGTLSSLNKSVWIDTASPNTDLSLSRTVIRPDGDSEAWNLKIDLNFDDPAGIEAWNLRITLAAATSARVDAVAEFRRVYKTFSGNGAPPGSIYWDGISDEGVPCESLENFLVEYEVRDRAGNLFRSAPRRLSSTLVFRPRQRGLPSLVARLPAQNYFDGQFQLGARGKDALDAVLASLARYERYNIIVECHAAAPGREEHNLEKTEKRARSMYRYLLARGFPKERLSYRGHGEAEPAQLTDDDFAHYRNDRIEIRLQLPAP